jgi:hypothetical protein
VYECKPLATGYGALLSELDEVVSKHVRGVVEHWAVLEVLPTWLEEAAKKGREGQGLALVHFSAQLNSM